jgi:hypothetical protein
LILTIFIHPTDYHYLETAFADPRRAAELAVEQFVKREAEKKAETPYDEPKA